MVARFQAFPGYLDSDYYYAGGVQLASGKGFTEPYLWNYLDDPAGLPHPSHTYWMPLASIIAAAGIGLASQATYAAGRLGFLVLGALVPIVTAALAFSFSHRRDLALTSGLLAVFSIYYAPFMPVVDNYGPYLVLGGLFFLLLSWRSNLAWLCLGVVTGLLSLARSDGLLWFGIAFVAVLLRANVEPTKANTAVTDTPERRRGSPARLQLLAPQMALVTLGFLAIMAPWVWHTYTVAGTLLAPGGAHLLWLRSYDETFIYPASQLTFGRWIAQGWQAIVTSRLAALRWNLLNAFAAQGGIVLFPFILTGIWHSRRNPRVRLGVLGWLALLFTMTIVFPFAGSRGGFFHGGAALQSLWWSLAPIGLDVAVSSARKRNLFTAEASAIFRTALVGLAALLTVVILMLRVVPGWGEGEQEYPKIEAYLVKAGMAPTDVVMVRNPPGYYLMTGRPAVVVPFGDASSMRAVADRYFVKYLILEQAGAAGPIKSVYDDTNTAEIQYLGEVDGTRLFRFKP
jgi:hypothetical protein